MRVVILTAGLLCLVYAQSDKCGTSVAPLVTRGRPIRQGEYPWLAALYQLDGSGKWEQFCGGALLSPRIVLTAAHCLVTLSREVIDPKDIKVGLGKLYRDFYRKEDFSNIVDVGSVVIPERYLGSASSYALDVGLLRLSTAVETTDYILPVCIDLDTVTPVFSGATVYAAGWGTSENGTSTDRALAADLSYLDYSKCVFEVQLSYRKYITHDKICAKSIRGSQVDRGDSGGALTFYQNGRHFVVGVVSTKIIDEQAFSIFTDLSNPEIYAWLKEEKTNLDKGGSQFSSPGRMKVVSKTANVNGQCIRTFVVSGNGISDTFREGCSSTGSNNVLHDDGTLFAARTPEGTFILFSNTPSTLTVISSNECTKNTYFNSIKNSISIPEDECTVLLRDLIKQYSAELKS